MPFRLAHFSDIHLSTPAAEIPWRALFSKRFFGWVNLGLLGRYSRLRDAGRVTAALVKDLESQRPDHILFTGDVTGLSLEREFKEARGLLAPLIDGGNISGIPGNHDVYTYSAERQRLYETYFGEWEKSDRPEPPPGVRLLGDDLALFYVKDSRPTALHDSSGKVGEEQLARLSELLDDPGLKNRRRILALHYGPRRADGRPDSRHHGLRDADELLAIARKGEVDLIVHGHLHNRFVLKSQENTPVPIANPGSLTYSAYDQAYHIYLVDQSGIRLEVRRFDDTTGAFTAWTQAGDELV